MEWVSVQDIQKNDFGMGLACEEIIDKQRKLYKIHESLRTFEYLN